MGTGIMEELNRSAQVFTELLGKIEPQLPATESESIKNLQELVRKLRIKLLELEVKRKYPDVKPDPALLELVGTESRISLEEEREQIRETLERKLK
ncbi:MAG: hypothetical protein DDT26_00459 [Dehalococcoidia bacterium]|nr:hypothetical protein [Chloroflexota bacterium]